MGFPSPEELERQKEADLNAKLELAEQLRRARLEKERLELERRGLDIDAARLDAETESNIGREGYPVFIGGGLISSGFNSFDRRRRLVPGELAARELGDRARFGGARLARSESGLHGFAERRRIPRR